MKIGIRNSAAAALMSIEAVTLCCLVGFACARATDASAQEESSTLDNTVRKNARDMVNDGRQIFRYDTLDAVVGHYNDCLDLGLTAQ